MTASLHGRVDIVGILIEAQAKVNIQNEVCHYKITYHKKHVRKLHSDCFVSTGWPHCSSHGS